MMFVSLIRTVACAVQVSQHVFMFFFSADKGNIEQINQIKSFSAKSAYLTLVQHFNDSQSLLWLVLT